MKKIAALVGVLLEVNEGALDLVDTTQLTLCLIKTPILSRKHRAEFADI